MISRSHQKLLTVGSVITQSFKQGCTDGRLIYISFADLIRGKYSIKDLSGPVGIVDTIDNVIDSERDGELGKIDWSSLIDTMMSLGAFMTINIGIFNLLPLPALDGGRLLFLIIEAVRRKPVKPEREGYGTRYRYGGSVASYGSGDSERYHQACLKEELFMSGENKEKRKTCQGGGTCP